MKTLYKLSKIRFVPENTPIETQVYESLEAIQEVLHLDEQPRLYTPIKSDIGGEWVVSKMHVIPSPSRIAINTPESPVTAFESNSGQTTHNEVATPQSEYERICDITSLIIVWILVVVLGAIVTYTLIANNITPQ